MGQERKLELGENVTSRSSPKGIDYGIITPHWSMETI